MNNVMPMPWRREPGPMPLSEPAPDTTVDGDAPPANGNGSVSPNGNGATRKASSNGSARRAPSANGRSAAPAAPSPVRDDTSAAETAPVLAAAGAPAFIASRGRVTISRVELWPLAWIAIRCAVLATGIGALAALGLWRLASSSGLVERTESFMESIGFREFEISADAVVLGLILIVGGLALLGAALVVLAGAAYNVLAWRGGGMRVRIDEVLALTPAPAVEPVPGDDEEVVVDEAVDPEDPATEEPAVATIPLPARLPVRSGDPAA